VKDGLLKDLEVTMSATEEVVDVFRAAFKRYPRGEGFDPQLSAQED